MLNVNENVQYVCKLYRYSIYATKTFTNLAQMLIYVRQFNHYTDKLNK